MIKTLLGSIGFAGVLSIILYALAKLFNPERPKLAFLISLITVLILIWVGFFNITIG